MAVQKKRLVILALLIIAIGGGVLYWKIHHTSRSDQLTIYGNVDIRQVQAAFDDNGRLLNLQVQEGDRVKKGQLLAELDPIRFQARVDKDAASVGVEEQVLARLLAGSRPEEIAGARAAVAAARATLTNAEITWDRQQALAAQQYVPKQSVDNAADALKNARANLDRAQQSLTLAVKGPRKEDIAAARQQLQAARAGLLLARRELADTRLYASADSVVQERILEPGDMATPQTPVFTLALDNPVWVRAYLPEKRLGQIRSGMRAEIESDSFPGKPFSGWIGYISPTAEFTPKSVETTDLRTELVYQIRIYACNPQHRLRLGMPVTVNIPLSDNQPKNSNTAICER